MLYCARCRQCTMHNASMPWALCTMFSGFQTESFTRAPTRTNSLLARTQSCGRHTAARSPPSLTLQLTTRKRCNPYDTDEPLDNRQPRSASGVAEAVRFLASNLKPPTHNPLRPTFEESDPQGGDTKKSRAKMFAKMRSEGEWDA